MERLSDIVREWISETSLSPNQVSRRAGISQSTMSRVLAGRVDPTAGTLTEIALACGFELDFAARPSSSLDAARAVRAMFEAGYPEDDDEVLTRWQERLIRFAASSDPVSLLRTAAQYASPLLHSDVVLFTGDITMGHVASAGDATRGQWAVSGAAGLTLPAPRESAPATTILWTEDPRRAAQLLTDSPLERTTRRKRATVAVLHANPALFVNTFTVGIVTYAAPMQLMLDCIAQGGAVAQAALEEVEGW